MGQDNDTRHVHPGGWDTYWKGASGTAAYAAGGATHPGIRAFWQASLARVGAAAAIQSMADIASGLGTVVEMALETLELEPGQVTCIDASAAAIAHVEGRFPGLHGLVCDAGQIPRPDANFDLVTSQFGIEYAGPDAFSEAARILAPGGTLVCLAHHAGGAIHQECARNLEATREMLATGFLSRARDLFRHGFAAVRGADRQPYDSAALALAPAARAVEELARRFAGSESGDTITRIYSDIATFHEKMPGYQPDEVLAWCERSEQELEAYAARMASMSDAALDEAGFKLVCKGLEDGGCVIETEGPFHVPDQTAPLAWALIARKTNA